MSIHVAAIVLGTLGNSKCDLGSCVSEPKQASNKAVVRHISRCFSFFRWLEHFSHGCVGQWDAMFLEFLNEGV